MRDFKFYENVLYILYVYNYFKKCFWILVDCGLLKMIYCVLLLDGDIVEGFFWIYICSVNIVFEGEIKIVC